MANDRDDERLAVRGGDAPKPSSQSDSNLSKIPRYKNHDVLEQYHRLCKESGVSPEPTLLSVSSEMLATLGVGSGTAIYSKEGNAYILIEPMSPEDTLFIIEHELGHLKDGDVTIRGDQQLQADKSNQAYRNAEFQADKNSADLCDGDLGVAFLQNRDTDEERQAEATRKDSDHPSMRDRRDRLQSQVTANQASGACPMKHHMDGDLLAAFKNLTGGDHYDDHRGSRDATSGDGRSDTGQDRGGASPR